MSHPVPFPIYEEMVLNYYWNGGWVCENNHLYYYTADGTQYEDNMGTDNQHPWPEYVYLEQANNSTWSGGWVLFTGDSIKYIPELNVNVFEGSGIGSGSGSGTVNQGAPTSSGKAITLGGGIIGTLLNGAFQLEAYWTEGNTVGMEDLAMVSFLLRVKNSSFRLGNVNLRSSWVAPYQSSILGDFFYTKDEVSHHCHIYGGSFTIPDEYRVESQES